MRGSIGNIAPEQLAIMAHEAGLDGFVLPNIGFGAWGTESGLVIESATYSDAAFLNFISTALRDCGEKLAYVTSDGVPYLRSCDGQDHPIPVRRETAREERKRRPLPSPLGPRNQARSKHPAA